MITEDYVSLEVAKLLKEKGFKKWWCYKSYGTAVYHKGVPISFDEECELKSDGLGDEIEYVEGGYLYDFGCDNSEKETNVWAAPTLWVAMKWLREVHKLSIEPYYHEVLTWLVDIKHIGKHTSLSEFEIVRDKSYDSYVEACEAAIKYCLENLI